MRAPHLALLASLSIGAPAAAAPETRELSIEFCWDFSPCATAPFVVKSNGRFDTVGDSGTWTLRGDQIRFQFDLGTTYRGRYVAPGCWEGRMTAGGGINGTWSMSADWAVCPS